MKIYCKLRGTQNRTVWFESSKSQSNSQKASTFLFTLTSFTRYIIQFQTKCVPLFIRPNHLLPPHPPLSPLNYLRAYKNTVWIWVMTYESRMLSFLLIISAMVNNSTKRLVIDPTDLLTLTSTLNELMHTKRFFKLNNPFAKWLFSNKIWICSNHIMLQNINRDGKIIR